MNIKKLFLLCFSILSVSLSTFCQKITTSDLLGKWVATNIPDGKMKFELNFHEDNIVYTTINGKETTQHYNIDSTSNLVQIKFKSQQNGEVMTLMMLIKYVDSEQLKVQVSNSPNLKTKWNSKETTNNTGLFKRKL